MNTADDAINPAPATKLVSKAFVNTVHLQLPIGRLAMDVPFTMIAIQTIVGHAIMRAVKAIIAMMAVVQMLAKMF